MSTVWTWKIGKFTPKVCVTKLTCFSWNITTMVANNVATWPVNPQKCYLDSTQGVWEHLTNENGACTEPDREELDSVFDTSGRDDMSAMDYYVNAADPIDDDNYGWISALDFDEYPLEIQCSSCFLYVLLEMILHLTNTEKDRNSEPDIKVLGAAFGSKYHYIGRK